jgi:outer membrane immunogenic protein
MRGRLRSFLLMGASALACPAWAADFRPPVAPVAPTYGSWTGFYGGAAAGVRWSDVRWETLGLAIPGFGVDPGFTDDIAWYSKAIGRIAGFAGANYQFGYWLAGIEGDFGFGIDGKKTHIGIPGTAIAGIGLPNADRTNVETEWEASIRARLGYLAAPNVLLYGTGGIAFQHIEAVASCEPFPAGSLFCGPPPERTAVSKTLVGWTAGAGIEAAFYGNWLARVEYRYADFGSFDHTFQFVGPATASPIVALDVRTHTTTFGIGYKFGAPISHDPPVAATKRTYPVKTPISKVPPMVAWTGFYLGATAGARWSEADWNTVGLFGTGFPPSPSSNVTLDRAAFRAGGFGGVNYQIERFVVGLEADIGRVSGSERSWGNLPGVLFTPLIVSGDSVGVETTWDASVRGRAGVLIAPNVLAYGTAGVAWQSSRLLASCDAVPGNSWCAVPHSESVTRTLTGWIAGGGLEAMFSGNWLARVEYRHAHFGTIAHSFFDSDPGDNFQVETHFRSHIVNLGLGYRF